MPTLGMGLLHFSLLLLQLVQGTPANFCHTCHCSLNQEAQLLADCSGRNLTAIPANIPANVTELILSHNLLHQVPPYSLEGLTRLKRLDLSHNALEHLHNDSFAGLARLQSLDLSSNELSFYDNRLPPGVFEPLGGLKHLELSHNLKDCPEQALVYPDAALSSLTALESLAMEGIEPLQLGQGFERLKNLTHLSFSNGHCCTEELTDDSFIHVSHLRHLHISGCPCLRNITSGVFSPLTRLEKLNLSSHTGLTLKKVETALVGLRNSNTLKVLDVSRVQRRNALGINVDITFAEKLKDIPLEELYVEWNNIEVIDFQVPVLLPRTLKLLSIKGNGIKVGDYLLLVQFMKSLKIVIASDMFFSLPEDFPWSHGDPRLGLHHPSSIRPLRLRRNAEFPISACFNKIFCLPPNVTDLDISNDKMKLELLEVHIAPNSIQKANLSNNLFTRLIGPVYGLENLRHLDLSTNYCHQVGLNAFDNFKQLLSLNLSHNFLGKFLRGDVEGKIFKNLRLLTHLILSNNDIFFLPTRVFQGLRALQYLDISGNSLTQLSLDISFMLSLEFFDLQTNLLPDLANVTTAGLLTIAQHKQPGGQVPTVLLHGNPWTCDCTNRDFWVWLQESQHKFRLGNLSHESCVFMQTKTNRSLSVPEDIVQNLNWSCKVMVGVLLLAVSLVIVVLSLLTAALVYRYRWKLRYLYYMTRRRYRQVHQEVDGPDYQFDAFISYAEEDRHFVIRELRQRVEQEHGLKLCIHDINFLPGKPIAQNILDAVQCSRRTVVVLSQDFLRSYWCRYEMQMAQVEEAERGQEVLLVLMYQDVPLQTIMPELIHVIKRDSYIEFDREGVDQDTFWSKFIEALQAPTK